MAILGLKRFRAEGDDGEVESVDVAADLLMMLSRRTGGDGPPRFPGRRLFRCKSCGRQFPSFQALGGHRASHKKPRLGGETQGAAPEKPRAHECPICGVEFAMGQALGGHMRRHRTGAGAFPLVFAEKKHAGEKRGVISLDLDLNLPPSDKDGDFCSLKLGLGHPVVGFLC